jgi:3-oxoacyl-[acyl-carrier protein] reductase
MPEHSCGEFSGKSVFITGAANLQGIGFATAAAFLDEDAAVFLFDVDRDTLAEAVRILAVDGKEIRSHVGDVRARDDVEAAVRRCEEEQGPIDILINHAGIGPSTHVLEMSEEEWDEVIGINLTGIFRVGQTVARLMVSRHSGVILNMSSSGAIAAEPGHAHYAASKAAILALTRAMAAELGPLGVRVCALCPGAIANTKRENVEWDRLYNAKIPAGRRGLAGEVASAYLFLASADARNLNGAALIVDGGMLAWE